MPRQSKKVVTITQVKKDQPCENNRRCSAFAEITREFLC